MGCHEKFYYIRTCDVQKHYYGVVLHKLLYKVLRNAIHDYAHSKKHVLRTALTLSY